MTDPYRITVRTPGCPTCAQGRELTITGPDGVEIGEAWSGEGAEEEAGSRVAELNAAYQAGKQGLDPSTYPWIPFATQLPPDGRVIVWDDELKMVSTLTYYEGSDMPEKLQYTHWKPVPPGPNPVAQIEPPVPADDEIPF